MSDLKTQALGLLARLSTERCFRIRFIFPLTEFFSSTFLFLTIVNMLKFSSRLPLKRKRILR